MEREVEFGGVRYAWDWWAGERLSGGVDSPIAFDTETELIRGPLHIPRLALAMAFDGRRLVVIHPDRVADFLSAHRSEHLVGHNLAFDFWVTHEHLAASPSRQRLLWDSGDRGRLHDTMILDQLLQLATGRYRKTGGSKDADVRLVPGNLAAVCETEGVALVDKEDPYRLRFGELLGLSQTAVDEHPEFAAGFAAYALGDVIATWQVYPRQRRRAVDAMRRCGWTGRPQPRYEIRHDALDRWGPLTEAIQVRASIVLAELSRTPLPIDREKRAAMEADTRAKYDAAYAILEAEAPGLFKRYKAKRFANAHRMTKRSLVPQMDQAVLKATLQRIADAKGIKPPQSDGKLGGISTSAKAWAKWGEVSPFLAAWCGLEKHAKLLEFLTTLDADAVYSRYNLLMRTGRTSAGAWRESKKVVLPSLNVQQMPRDADVRSLFVAPAGKVLFACDYSYVELRTLAASAFARFGWSKLRDAVIDHTLRGGLDPHQRTAARLLGLSESEFLRLPKEQQKTIRQSAKALNFGYPGGLGVEKFRAYAETSYGVRFTAAEAKEGKAAWMATYPEMEEWLADHTRDALLMNLGDAAAAVLKRMSDWRVRQVSDLLRGSEKQPPKCRELAWEDVESLVTAARQYPLLEAVQERERSRELRLLTTYRVAALTGRVRANSTFSETTNGAFQGLAADAFKEALWRVRYHGLRLFAGVHDELVVLLDADKVARDSKRVERLMCQALEDVTGEGVPAAVEGHAAPCWAKP